MASGFDLRQATQLGQGCNGGHPVQVFEYMHRSDTTPRDFPSAHVSALTLVCVVYRTCRDPHALRRHGLPDDTCQVWRGRPSGTCLDEDVCHNCMVRLSYCLSVPSCVCLADLYSRLHGER